MMPKLVQITVIIDWHLVPANLHPRSWYAEKGIKIPRNAEFQAIKGDGQAFGKPRYSFLFSEGGYLK